MCDNPLCACDPCACGVGCACRDEEAGLTALLAYRTALQDHQRHSSMPFLPGRAFGHPNWPWHRPNLLRGNSLGGGNSGNNGIPGNNGANNGNSGNGANNGNAGNGGNNGGNGANNGNAGNGGNNGGNGGNVLGGRTWACPDSVEQMDTLCEQALHEFKQVDPNAAILPGIGLPSQNNGVCTITHRMPGPPKNLKIDGLESRSPLANNALFSSECSDGRRLNLYEMMVPDVQNGVPGAPSSAEVYVNKLKDWGASVAGVHFHWWGSDPYVAAVHHQNVGMSPVDFARHTAHTLNQVFGPNAGNAGNMARYMRW